MSECLPSISMCTWIREPGCIPTLPRLLPVTEYSPGLEGVVAAQTAISEVDGANGRLIYRGGYLIEDLAPAVSFEEASYLLWNGELPNRSQLDALRHEMAAARKLKDSTRSVIP